MAEKAHPPGIVVEIVGTLMGDRGRSCEEHSVCGSVLEEDMVVRLRKVQILVDGMEETAIACYWVTDGIDRCRVGRCKETKLAARIVAYAHPSRQSAGLDDPRHGSTMSWSGGKNIGTRRVKDGAHQVRAKYKRP